MVELGEVAVAPRPLADLTPLIGHERATSLEAAVASARHLLGTHVIFNVNSTASGGGVAEMLHVLLGYVRGADIDARWVVIDADPTFFATTKRLHNRLHGVPGDPGPLGPEEADHYAEITRANAVALRGRIRPGDVVLLHDPQTAGMVRILADAGAKVIWRSHIGADHPNAWTDEAWSFLRPHLDGCDAFIFSRRAYSPPWLPDRQISIIPPSIDPFSPKNQAIPEARLPAFLARIGLTAEPARGTAAFTREDGTEGEVVRPATIVSDGGPLADAGDLVVQVSRWDHLKDMQGVMAGFAARAAGRTDATLALVGPSIDGVADDPEGATVYGECVAAWEILPPALRRRIHLLSLPMVDLEENAAMVNALQRASTIIVQKSLAEGFGLTVAEGMWKGKPVVASRVGGIIDQVVPGTGILLDDPSDLDGFGDAVAGLLEAPDELARMGADAHRHVLAEFIGDRHLRQLAAMIQRLLSH